MVELIAAFIIGWMCRPIWDFFVKPVFKNAIKEYKEKNQ